MYKPLTSHQRPRSGNTRGEGNLDAVDDVVVLEMVDVLLPSQVLLLVLEHGRPSLGGIGSGDSGGRGRSDDVVVSERGAELLLCGGEERRGFSGEEAKRERSERDDVRE